MSRYGEKIARMRSGVDTRRDFILADAKDADMAGGISAMGARRDGLPGYRARADYLEDIKAVVRQDIVDIMLVSASNLEKLLDEGVFPEATFSLPSARTIRAIYGVGGTPLILSNTLFLFAQHLWRARRQA